MVQIPFKFSPRSIPPQFITVHCGECFFNRDIIYREFRIYLFTYSLGTYFLFVIFSPREIIISLARRSPIRTRFGWKRGVEENFDQSTRMIGRKLGRKIRRRLRATPSFYSPHFDPRRFVHTGTNDTGLPHYVTIHYFR